MKNSFRKVIVALLTVAVMGCDNGQELAEVSGQQGARPIPVVQAHVVYHGGPILTIEPMAEVEAMAIREGQIMAVGTMAEVEAVIGAETTVIDLEGKTLMPGLVEPHTHIDVTASVNLSVNVGIEELGQTVANVKAQLTAALPDVPENGWLQATQFDPSRNAPRWATLTLADLDEVSTTVPIFVLNDSGHIAYVNSKALELAGITNDTPDPPGGTYVKDGDGNLTGVLLEPPAYVAFYRKIPPTPQAELTRAYRSVLEEFSKAGVTTLGDLNTGLNYGLTQELAIFRELAATSPIRIRSYLSFLALPKDGSVPVEPGEGDDKLKFVGIKFTADGSTQGYTGALHEPYVPTEGGHGSGNLDYPSVDVLLADMKPFFDAGWQIATHANGDRAIDQVLDVYSALLAGNPDPAARRLRVEHFTVSREDQVDRLKSLGVTPSMTIGHTFYWGDVFRTILGLGRADRIDPTASIKARNIRFSFHSDSPVTSVAPLRYVEEAVLRIPQGSTTVLGANQRISVDDALRAVTIDPAFQLLSDDTVGSLEPGKHADFLILSENPRTAPVHEISEIDILEVHLGGVRVQ